MGRRGVRARRRPSASPSAPTTCSTARSIGRTTSGTHRTRQSSTALEAGRRARGRRSDARRSCARRGCAASTARTWCAPCCGSPPSTTRCRSSTTRSASPTFTADLAPMLRRLALERRSGIHHVTNQSAVSWFEFARRSSSAMGKDPAMVRPISRGRPRPATPGPAAGQQRARQRGPSRSRPAPSARLRRAARRAGRPVDDLTPRRSGRSSETATTRATRPPPRRRGARCRRGGASPSARATSGTGTSRRPRPGVGGGAARWVRSRTSA